MRDEVDVTAAHPADGGAELLVEVELGDGVADELLVREGDAAEVQVVAVLDDVVRRDVPEVLGDLVEHEAGPDHGHEVVVADQLAPAGTIVGLAACACFRREMPICWVMGSRPAPTRSSARAPRPAR